MDSIRAYSYANLYRTLSFIDFFRILGFWIRDCEPVIEASVKSRRGEGGINSVSITTFVHSEYMYHAEWQ